MGRTPENVIASGFIREEGEEPDAAVELAHQVVAWLREAGMVISDGNAKRQVEAVDAGRLGE